MSVEELTRLIEKFAEKGSVSPAEFKILKLKAKNLELSDTALQIMVNEALKTRQSFIQQDQPKSSVKGSIGSQSPAGNEGAIMWGIAGFILGIPASYLFQGPKIRGSLSLGEYLQELPDLLSSDKADFATPVVLTCIILSLLFYFIARARSN